MSMATLVIPRSTPGEPPVQEPDIKRVRQHERALSRLLVAYITAGLTFMLLPGTFLGVWNLLKISGEHAAESVSPGWIQAHGHAQVFGWIGTFILGIGFYSIPKLRRGERIGMASGWVAWALWTTGVALRWFANVYLWHWRILLPLSAAMLISAFLIFARVVSSHRAANGGTRLETWARVVIGATAGLFCSLFVNLAATIYLAWRGAAPDFPHVFDQRYLVLLGWGFLAAFVWGFSARWLPVFLGLGNPRERWMWRGFILNASGVVLALFGATQLATWVLAAAAVTVCYALRIFEPAMNEPKTLGVHRSFPAFVRIAYVWLLIATALAIWAAHLGAAPGVWGASRHSLTVGFVALMVFSIGQRILPAFAGMKLLFSKRLMFLSTAALVLGCSLRVSSEVLAYQEYAGWAWHLLPVSAMIEMTAVTLFAINVAASFLQRRPAPAVPIVMKVMQSPSNAV
jgi:hypothetical protein